MEFKTILHATDFSDASLRALEQARQLARFHGARLHVLHVQIILEARYPTLALASLASQRESSEQQLRAMLADGGDDNVVMATVEHTRAAVAIAEYAESHGIDLIVVGSHGYSGIDRLLMGSEARKLIRYAHAPVLVVRAGVEPVAGEAPYDHLLAPVDFSEASKDALLEADKLAARYGADLTVVHSLDVVTPTHYAYVSSNTQMPLARQALGKFISEAGLTTTEVQQVVSAASAPTSILDTAKDKGADLIVIARSGMGGLQRFLVGSTTERILNSAGCDVLVLPAPAK